MAHKKYKSVNSTDTSAYQGYLREIETSDYQDACGQYYIEIEIDGGLDSVPVIDPDSTINMDWYVNRFVDVVLDEEITYAECSAFKINQIAISNECLFPVSCLVNPCEVAQECQVNTSVECVANYCDGCYADFYDLDGNLVDCNASTDECKDLPGVNFGVCTAVLGIGYVNGECSYVSGCDLIADGIDYSDALFDSMDVCLEVCSEDSFTPGDINNDSLIDVLDIVQLVNFVLQTDSPTDTEFNAADYNTDNALNVLDIVGIVNLIVASQVSIQINSGTSFGECGGYCVFDLALDNGMALFTASSWDMEESPDLTVTDILSQETWQPLVDYIDFDYFQSLDEVYGCPDCADGGAEYIEIIYDGVEKQVTFNAYSEIAGIEELTLLLRNLRVDYWEQINSNQPCNVQPEIGPCDGICPTYYYNQDTNQCDEFITGCCGVESFDALQECVEACDDI